MDKTHREFLKDRRKALLSMKKATIEAYCQKYGDTLPQEESVFWLAIHKARTGATDLPLFERAASKRWLHLHGSEAMDGGEVWPPIGDPVGLDKYFKRLEKWGVGDTEIKISKQGKSHVKTHQEEPQ